MNAPSRPLPIHAPLQQFPVAAGQLLIGNIPLEQLARGFAADRGGQGDGQQAGTEGGGARRISPRRRPPRARLETC